MDTATAPPRKKTSRILRIAEFELASRDPQATASLLASGIHPDAKTRGSRMGLPRAPFWLASASTGPQALESLLAAGCSFAPEPDASGEPLRALQACLRAGPSSADWILSAVESGKIPKERVVDEPRLVWTAFAELCESQARHRRHLEADGMPFEPLERFVSAMRALRARVAPLAGEPSDNTLAAMSAARVHLPLALHLEGRELRPMLAQSILDARLEFRGQFQDRKIHPDETAFATMAGSALLIHSPRANLALDAESFDATSAAFACAALPQGACEPTASEPPLAALMARACDLMLGDTALIAQMSALLRRSSVDGPRSAHPELLTAQILADAGCSFLAKGRRGLDASSLADKILEPRPEPRSSTFASVMGMLGALPASLGLGSRSPIEALAHWAKVRSEAEAISSAAANPDRSSKRRSSL